MSADHVLGKVQQAVDKMSTSDVCFSCLAWLYELFVGRLISLTNVCAGCGRPTLNFIERYFLLGSLRSLLSDSEATSPRVSRAQRVCTDYVDQFSMNKSLKIWNVSVYSLSYFILSYHSLYYSLRHK